MANKNFTDFTLKTPASGDFLVGYNAEGSSEFKTTVSALVSSYATNTALNAASSVLLPTSVFRTASATFATNTALNAASSILLPTSVYQNISGSFATNTALNAASSVLLPTSVFRTASATFATNTALNAASSILLPTSVYQNTSGSFATRAFTDSKYLPLSTTNISYTNLTTTNALITNLTATNLTNTQTINLSTLNSDISNFLVTSQGSLSARKLGDRFAEVIDVRDFGAKGDWNPYDANIYNGTDDTLAIQRAIYAAGNNVTPAETFNLTFDELNPANVSYYGNKRMPTLYRGVGPGSRIVYLPAGFYKISRPLVLAGEHICLIGVENGKATNIVLDYRNGKFNCIETLATYIAREKQQDMGYIGSGNATTNTLTVTGTYIEPTYQSSLQYGTTLDTGYYNNVMYTNGQRVQFLSKTGGSGVSTSTTYYVINVNNSSNTFQLASTPNGTAISLGTNITHCVVQALDPVDWWLNNVIGDFIAGTQIENLQIQPIFDPNIYPFSYFATCESCGLLDDNNVASNINDLVAYQFPFKPGIRVARVSGSAGSTVLSAMNPSSYELPPGGKITKIKLWNDSTVYTVVSSDIFNNKYTIEITPPLSQNHDWSVMSFLLPKSNGIFIAGGENTRIKHCLISWMCPGAGIIVWGGSPNQIIDNCMCNANGIAYWIENAPATMIKPSGDSNSIFIRSGIYGYGNLVVIGMKVEDGQQLSNRAYTIEENSPSKCQFQFGTKAAGRAANYVITGGSVNPGNWGLTTDATLFDIRGYWGHINLISEGLTTVGFGKYLYTYRDFFTGKIIEQKPRADNDSGENDLHIGPRPPLFNSAFTDYSSVWKGGHLQFLPRINEYDQTCNTGIIGDRYSGMMTLTSSFTRSVSTVTFQYPNHGLRVGDLINPYTYVSTVPSSTTINGLLATWAGAIKVQAVTNNTFSISAYDTGATSGVCYLKKNCYFDFHSVDQDNHIFQMPNQLGNMFDSRKAFTINDYQQNHIAGLRVATSKEGEWWASKSLNIGGTIASPSASILTGLGIPNMSAPNGSIYLRADGGASSTIYARVNSTWVAMSSAI